MKHGLSPSVEVAGVPAAEMTDIWPEVAPLLARAVVFSAGRMNMDLLEKAVKARDMQLWVARVDGKIVGAWVTRLASHIAGAKLCEIVFCGGGDLERWMTPGLAVTEAWAVAQGYPRIEVLGRHGWERLLKPYGYRKRYVVLEKDI